MKIIFIVIFCLLFIIVSLRLISHVTFQSANPIVAGVGLVRIYIFGVEYVIIKDVPQIIITKPKNSLNRLVKYMNDQGFTMTEELGSSTFFENDIEKQSININTNRYCSRWKWN
jgi:hypothetical protein